MTVKKTTGPLALPSAEVRLYLGAHGAPPGVGGGGPPGARRAPRRRPRARGPGGRPRQHRRRRPGGPRGPPPRRGPSGPDAPRHARDRGPRRPRGHRAPDPGHRHVRGVPGRALRPGGRRSRRAQFVEKPFSTQDIVAALRELAGAEAPVPAEDTGALDAELRETVQPDDPAPYPGRRRGPRRSSLPGRREPAGPSDAATRLRRRMGIVEDLIPVPGSGAGGGGGGPRPGRLGEAATRRDPAAAVQAQPPPLPPVAGPDARGTWPPPRCPGSSPPATRRAPPAPCACAGGRCSRSSICGTGARPSPRPTSPATVSSPSRCAPGSSAGRTPRPPCAWPRRRSGGSASSSSIWASSTAPALGAWSSTRSGRSSGAPSPGTTAASRSAPPPIAGSP